MSKWIEKKVDDLIRHLLNKKKTFKTNEFLDYDLEELITFLENY